MSNKIYGIPVGTPMNPAKIDPAVSADKIASSVASYMEEHPITPSSIGARPDSWTPTASDVGAAPKSHTEDKNNPHGVTAEQAGAAPSGYGLGEGSPKWVATLDQVTSPGWYGMSFAVSDLPAGASHGAWYFFVDAFKDADNLEIVLPITSNYIYSILSKLRRRKWNGSWQDWEWEHPPMNAGVEYRTTKRFNSYPVYQMFHSVGWADKGEHTFSLPISHEVGRACRAVSISVMNNEHEVLTSHESVSVNCGRYEEGVHLSVKLKLANALGHVQFVVEYIKM